MDIEIIECEKSKQSCLPVTSEIKVIFLRIKKIVSLLGAIQNHQISKTSLKFARELEMIFANNNYMNR